MTFVQIFVEDARHEPYRELANKLLPQGTRVRVAQVHLNELTSMETLQDFVNRSARAGATQVIFMMDFEDGTDAGRRKALRAFERVFQELCTQMDNHSLRVVRIEVHTCLECWLLSDPQAIVRAFGGPSNYAPSPKQTDRLRPQEALEQIAHILREVGRRVGKHRLQQTKKRAAKRLAKRIAPAIDLDTARQYNCSLEYFCQVIAQTLSGCKHPFPCEPPL